MRNRKQRVVACQTEKPDSVIMVFGFKRAIRKKLIVKDKKS